MSTEIIKTNQGRKRFLKTLPLVDFSNWQSDLTGLKNFLSLNSVFQIVGKKVYFEFSSEREGPKMMLEVIGLPIKPEKNTLILADMESCDVLVHKVLGFDLFTLDSEQLLSTAWGLKRALGASFTDDQGKLSDIFHIVFDYDKIELHFFRQKDYIQKQF